MRFRLKEIISIGMLIASFGVPMAAFSSYYDEHSKGWFWYEDPTKKNSSKEMHQAENSDALMEALHKEENTAINRMYFNPTEENIKSYMVLQDKIQKRAMLLTDRWKSVMLHNPNLDYSIQHPTTSQGRDIYLSQIQNKADGIIAQFSQQNGLFFFYRGDCPYCHQFSPILKSFSERYGIRIIPVSLGAGFLPEFPNSKVDDGQAALLHVTVYPSLFAVNPKTQKIFPISYGLMSFEELKERIVDIMTNFQGDLS